MPVRSIKAQVGGKVREFKMDLPDDVTQDEIMGAISAYLDREANPPSSGTPFVDSILRGDPRSQIPPADTRRSTLPSRDLPFVADRPVRRPRGPVPEAKLESSDWEQKKAAGDYWKDIRGAQKMQYDRPILDQALDSPRTLIESIGSGALSTIGGIASAADAMTSRQNAAIAALGDPNAPDSGRKPPETVAQRVAKWADRNATESPSIATRSIQGKSFIDDPSLLYQPDYILTLFGNAAGSSIPLMVGSGGSGAAAVNAASKAVPVVERILAARPVLKKAAEAIAGTAGASFIETLSDAGLAYRNAVKDGKPEEKAAEVFTETMKREMPATVLGNVFDPMVGGKWNAILTPVLGGAGEVLQGVAQRSAENKVLGTNKPLLQGAPEEWLAGTMVAAIGGGGTALATRRPRGQARQEATLENQQPAAQASTVEAQAPTPQAPTPEAPQSPALVTVDGTQYQILEPSTPGGSFQVAGADGTVVFDGNIASVVEWLNSRQAKPAEAPVPAGAPADPAIEQVLTANPGRVKLGIVDEAETVGRSNYAVPVQYALVESDVPIASHDEYLQPNEAFPAEVQPRDRERAASEEQIMNITDPDQFSPRRLTYSVMASTGAPLLGTDMVVESGNGRMIALRRIYQGQPEEAQRYREQLKRSASLLGLSPADVDSMKAPVLVRVRYGALPEGVDRQQFATDANNSDMGGMSATEQARIDAKVLTPEILALFTPDESGKLDTIDNQEFIRLFREAAVRPHQANDFMRRDGSVTPKGIARIRNAIFLRAYGDPSAVENLAEDTDPNIGNILNGMMAAAPKTAVLQADIERGIRHDLSIGESVAKVAQRISSLRRRKQNIQDYLNQQEFEGRDPVEQGLMEAFHEFRRSGRRIGDVLTGYVDAVEALGDPNQPSMFGDDQIPSRVDILKAVIQDVRQQAEAERLAKASRPDQGAEGSPTPATAAGETPAGTGAGTGTTPAASGQQVTGQTPEDSKPSKRSRKPRIGKVLADTGAGMTFRELAQATDSSIESVRDQVQALHKEGLVELIPAEGGPDWANPETEMIQDENGNRFIGVRPIESKIKQVRAKRGERGSIRFDFLTGRWANEYDPAPEPVIPEHTRKAIEAAGLPTPSSEQYFTKVSDMILAATRVYRHLPQGKYPALVFELKRLEKAAMIASQKAQDAIRRITYGLSRNEFKGFRYGVIFNDQYETMMQFVRDGELKMPLQYQDLGNGVIRIPLDALAKSPGKEKANPKNVAQMKLDWERGVLPAVIEGRYSTRNGQIITDEAEFVDAARLAKLSHVDVRLGNMDEMQSDQAQTDFAIKYAFDQTFDEIRTNRDNMRKYAAENPRVQAALDRRRAIWKRLRDDLVAAYRKAGLDLDPRLQREDYYRHRVLENVADKLRVMESKQGSAGGQLPTGRSYTKARHLNALPYSTHYIESEYEIMSQILADTFRAEFVGFMKNSANGLNMMDALKAQAKAINMARVIEEFAAKGLSGADVATWSNWRRSTLVETLAEAAAQGQLPTSPEYQALHDELAEAWMDHAANDRPLRLTSPTESFVKYVGWLRSQYGAGGQFELSGDYSPSRRAIRRAITTLGRPGRFSEHMLKQVLDFRYVKWSDLVPETHQAWNPMDGHTFYMANTLVESKAQEILEAGLNQVGVSAEDLRKVVALGAKQDPIVVPKEVALTMRDLRLPKQKSPFGKFWVNTVISSWKRWKLLTPVRFFLYELRNTLGDSESTFVGNPGAFRYAGQSAKELWNWYRNRVSTPDMMAWFERGGFKSGITVNELEDLGNDKHFKKLMNFEGQDPAGGGRFSPFNWWFEKVGAVSEFREGILRYANYLHYLNQLRSNNGKPLNYGASRPSDVDALRSNEDKAYKLSNDLLGSYDELTEGGKTIRDYIIPFWSFQELNFRRYKWLVTNAARDARLSGTVGRALLGAAVIRMPLVAMRLGAALMKILFGFWALTYAWNYFFQRENDESLPVAVRSVPHLTLGKDSETNKVRVLTRLGNLPDLAEWLDIGEGVKYFNDYRDGRIDGLQLTKLLAKHAAITPAEKVVLSAIPPLGLAGQYLSGHRLYPDITNPRPIRDRGAWIADELQLRWLYDVMLDKPSGPAQGRVKRLLTSPFFKEYDPLESAYWDTMDRRKEFFRRINKAEPSPSRPGDNERVDAAYNLRLAVRRNDEKAFRKYLIEYYEAGGTKKALDRSAQSFHPLYRMREEKEAFIESLPAEDRQRLALAIRFWEETFGRDGRLRAFLEDNFDVRPGRAK